MATVILRGARTYHVAGLVFRLGEPQRVDDPALARSLADLPDYFEVRFEESRNVPAKNGGGGGVKIKARAPAPAPPIDPASAEPDGVEI